jgi:hypothetical protein
MHSLKCVEECFLDNGLYGSLCGLGPKQFVLHQFMVQPYVLALPLLFHISNHSIIKIFVYEFFLCIFWPCFVFSCCVILN